MADSDSSEKQAREALLKAIAEAAPSAVPSGLEQLANAFAMTVGARFGRLPGCTPPA